MTELPERFYVIAPRNVGEALHGKACLLTDTMIAQVLDVLRLAEATTVIGQSAVEELWCKFLGLWADDSTPAPKESDVV